MIKYNELWGWIIKIISGLLPPGKIGARIRGMVFRPFLKSCGKRFCVAEKSYLYNPNKIAIGNNVWFGYNTYFGEGQIEIGDNVIIGPYVSVTASNHNRKNGTFRYTGYTEKKIKIDKNVWIGAHSCILSGVNVGEGSLVGAGSIVNKNVEKNTLVCGVPIAKIKRF